MLSHRCLWFLVILALLLPSITMAADQKKLRARQCYYKAKVYYEMGLHRKSTKLLKTATRLDPGNVYFQNAMNQFIATSGRKASIRNNAVKKVSQPMQMVLSSNNSGIYNSGNGMHRLSRKAFEQAMDAASLAGLANDTLLSHLYNNQASAMLMDQAVCKNGHADAQPHLSIHINIVLKACALYDQALQQFPGNTTAMQNLQIIFNTMDSLDQLTLTARGYNPLQRASSVWFKGTKSDGSNEFQISEPVPKVKKSAVLATSEFKELVVLLEQYDEIVLLLDNSISMEERLPELGQSRFEVMKRLLTQLLVYLDEDVALGCLSVSGSFCSSPPILSIPPAKGQQHALLQSILQLDPKGKTPLDLRMQQAASLFTDASKRRIILICSDGLNTCNGFNTCDIAQELRQRGIEIHVLSLLVDKMRHLKEYAVYDCVSELGGGKLWKIDHQGEIEQTVTEIPVLLYPVKLPSTISKLKCLGKGYHHTYTIPLPAKLTIDESNGWKVRNETDF